MVTKKIQLSALVENDLLKTSPKPNSFSACFRRVRAPHLLTNSSVGTLQGSSPVTLNCIVHLKYLQRVFWDTKLQFATLVKCLRLDGSG